MDSLKKRLGVFRAITRDGSPPEPFPSYSDASLSAHSSLYPNSSDALPLASTVASFKSSEGTIPTVLLPSGSPKYQKSSQCLRQSSPTKEIFPQKFGPKNSPMFECKLMNSSTLLCRSRNTNYESSLSSSSNFSNRSFNIKISTEECSREETEERRKPKKRPLEEAEKNFYVIRIDAIFNKRDSRTTVMIKNIPNKYTQRMLLQTIDKRFAGTYDFLYLPIDFKNRCNVGYAFINFLDFSVIVEFYKEFNDKRWEKFNSEKICALAYARIQGLQDLVHHFQNSSVINQEDNKVKPIILAKN